MEAGCEQLLLADLEDPFSLEREGLSTDAHPGAVGLYLPDSRFSFLPALRPALLKITGRDQSIISYL